MVTRGVRITLLVEDAELERFIRQVLKQFNIQIRDLRIPPYLPGQGSMKAWIDKQFPKELQLYRSKSHDESIWLILGTDADQLTVAERKQQLETAAKNLGLEPRGAKERIIFWIPKWHIETWLLHFSKQPVTESDRYKDHWSKFQPQNYVLLAAEFITEYREFTQNNSLDTLDSLRQAYLDTEQRLSM